MAGEEDPETVLADDKLKDNPIASIDLPVLKVLIDQFHKEFEGKGSVTLEELHKGAKLARSYGYHTRETPEVVADPEEGEDHEEGGEEIACCMASFTQGWDQVANGNLGWPSELGLNINAAGMGTDIWAFGAANAITWFAAAILGPFLVDPICHSKIFGRRGAVFFAASFSFASMIGGSLATSWQGYLIARLFLGIGIGAKASIVPIWESEVLPPAKRGRLLVSWQVFTATGIFVGSIATYIFRDNWRNQVLSGALPALLLLVLTYIGCESPRWLILQGEYLKAFETLVKLRRERVLAAEELCYIYFQIQAERALLRGKKQPDYTHPEPRIAYSDRLPKIVTLARNRRAAIASMIVMLSQQLSGINILAFLASIFFSATGLRSQGSDQDNAYNSLRLTIGFGAANAIFSILAYFLIEPLPVDYSLDEDFSDIPGLGPAPAPEVSPDSKKKKRQLPRWLLGRRSLLLLSLASGTVMLFILTFLLGLDENNSAKLPFVMIFIMLFTLCYSPGAGCVPFLYSAEVWPNEGREVGMSWAVFWNFLGAGFLAFFVPRGFQWGSSKLFGLFTFSFIGFILVYLFVPGTDHAISLEEMSRRFNYSLVAYGKDQIKALKPSKKKRSPRPKMNPPAGETPAEPLPGAETRAQTNGLSQPPPEPINPPENKELGQTTVAPIQVPPAQVTEPPT